MKAKTHSDSHDHRACVKRALAQADALCETTGARLTPVRRRVLELVWQSHRAAKTYDLLAELEKESAAAKPPTIYRALDFLASQGLVHKLESLRAYVGCSHPGQEHICCFQICDCCERVSECCDDQITEVVKAQAKKSGFAIRHQQLEVHGVCKECKGCKG